MVNEIIQKYFRSPVFPESEDRTRRARDLNWLIWGVGLLLIGQTLATISQHSPQSYVPAILLILGMALVVAAQTIMRHGRIRTASWAIVGGFWILDTLRVFLSGQAGIIYPSLYLTLIVFAALLLGNSTARIMAIVSSLVSLYALMRTTNAVGSLQIETLPMPQWLVFVWSVVLLIMVLSRELDRLRSMIFERQIQISESQRSENIMKARLRLTEFAATHTLDELLQTTLDELCALSESTVGFFHFVMPDQATISLQAWSTRTLAEFCEAGDKKGHAYNMEDAGVWTDCLREKKPIIHNDYASLPHRKGMPEGHATLTREMIFPIIRDDKFVAIIGVGNKAQDYTEADVAYAMRLADLAWDITERKHAEEEQKKQVEIEQKRHQELEKLREISASMRQADRSGSLLQVFTREVQEFCNAEITSSLLFKSPKELVTYSSPKEDIQLTPEQSEAITLALLNAKTDNLDVSIPGFESNFILPLQSADTIHGAVMIASRTQAGTNQAEQNMLNAIADMAGTALHRIDILETLEERVQRRTHDLVVLYNLITIISENWRLQDLLELSMVLTLETVNADRGIIYLTDGKDSPDLKPVIQRGFGDGFQIEMKNLPDDELAQEVFKQQKPLSLEDLENKSAYKKFDGLVGYAGVPILTRGEIRGVFSLFTNEKDVFGADEMALLASIADHLGIGIENSILIEQSRENAALEERNRLARNLHDSVSQLLYGLTLMAGTTKKMLEQDTELGKVKISVDRFADTAHQALKEMRLLLYELRPAVLDSEGLVVALQHRIETVEERLGLRVKLETNGLPELPSAMEDALYHIALEALNNIVKHSGSTTASIVFNHEDSNVAMEISDEGKGFDTHQPSKGMGLRNMRERGQMLGGEVVIDSEPGQGTSVTVNAKIPSVSLVES